MTASHATPLLLEAIAIAAVDDAHGKDTAAAATRRTSDNRTATEWTVCQRLVTVRPTLRQSQSSNHGKGIARASVEVVWEVSSPSPTFTNKFPLHPCRQRIAVYSGPDSVGTGDGVGISGVSPRTLHVSLELPESAQAPPPAKNRADFASDALAWAHFPEQPFPVLCCLIHPNALCLWEVYFPNDDPNEEHHHLGKDLPFKYVPLPSEGWTVPLPFDCGKILALPSSLFGLLLQRIPDETSPKDDTVMSQNSFFMEHDDNDGFVLQGPPMSWKQQQQKGGGALLVVDTMTPKQSSAHDAMATKMRNFSSSQTPRAGMTTSNQVASLFSLHHPLEDVLPVTTTTPPSFTTAPSSWEGTIADPAEQVVWVGETEWLQKQPQQHAKLSTLQRHSAHLLVTYHSTLQRHAVWSIDRAPEPPRPPPLHQRTRQLYPPKKTRTNQWDDMEFMAPSHNQEGFDGRPHSSDRWSTLWDDAAPPLGLQLPFSSGSSGMGPHSDQTGASAALGMDVSLGGRAAAASLPSEIPTFLSGRVTRDQALADALGVHRSPRKSLGQTTGPPPGPAVAATLSSATGGGGRHHTMNVDPTSTTAMSSRTFFSPNETTTNANDNSHGMSLQQQPAVAAAAAPTGFANCLYPKVALTLLYSENAGVAKAVSDQIFLTSNHDATGLLTLAMFATDERTLSFFALVPTMTGRFNDKSMSIRVDRINTTTCIAAVPVCAYPAPKRSISSKEQLKSAWITDALVLQEDNTFALFRGHLPRIPCTLPATGSSEVDMRASIIAGIVDPVADSFTVELLSRNSTGTTSERLRARCKVNTSLVSECCLSERVLLAIEASLYANEPPASLVDVTMGIRADCCRLYQSMRSNSLPLPLAQGNSLAFAALRTVLLHLLEYHFTGALQRVTDSSNDVPSDEPWQTLLQSDFHQSFMADNVDIVAGAAVSGEPGACTSDGNCLQILLENGSLAINAAAPTIQLFHRVFDALHILYEDLKLTMNAAGSDSLSLASLLVRLANLAQTLDSRLTNTAQPFLEYYRQDLGDDVFQSILQSSRRDSHLGSESMREQTRLTSFVSPPSVLPWIEKALKPAAPFPQNDDAYDVNDPNIINPSCPTTRSIVRIFSLWRSETGADRDAILALAMLDEGYTDATSIQSNLPLGVALPLLDALFQCRNRGSSIAVPGWSAAAWRLVGREDLALNMSVQSINSGTLTHDGRGQTADDFLMSNDIQSTDDVARDGLVPLERGAVMLFPHDNRIHEAARLLCSSRPIFLRVTRAVEVSDHDYERLKQKQLLLLSYRSLALPSGRGMLTIGSLRLVPAEPLPLPDICLKGRVPPTNATLNLDISDCPADLLVWPEFHDGVAAGLRLPANDELSPADSSISRTWISFNKPPVTRSSQPQETGSDASPSSQGHSFSHGGLLFALGLRGHLTSLEMSDVYEYLTQSCATTTVGVLLGLAVNKRGSCDIAISKMLCLHIPSLIPQHFSAIDVASTVQTAAIAASGLLFQGSSHRMMTEFLLNEIGKRPETDVNTCDREAYTLACGLALGTVNLCLGDPTSSADRTAGLADLHIEERLIRYIVGGVDGAEVDRTRESNDRFSVPNASSGNDSERCSTIFESNMINTSVTAPGATLALGLLYMKSNNNTIAAALSLPDTHFLLEFVRADLLGLRVISRALILWDDVLPSDEWIAEQVPRVVQTAYQHMGNMAKSAFGIRSPVSKPRQDVEYDRRAIRQIYVHVVSAACFGIGLRFAGTGNKEAKSAVMKRVLELHSLREASDPVSVACRPEMAVLETCLGCSAISLAMILAGTGDLDALRVFKILRWRCDSESQYGIHMTYGMAIGLLFLGGGTCTLGREPADIAALITAFFPRYPMATSDNQYHLQALRHLYAIAVKRKELRAIDVDTKEYVHVAVEVAPEGSMTDPVQLQLPCLLLNTDSPLRELRVLSGKYYPLTLRLSRSMESRHFYVKSRNSQSNMKKSMLRQRSLDHSNGVLPNMAQLIQSSSSNPFLAAFAERFGGLFIRTTWSRDSDYVHRCIRECLLEDTQETLGMYLTVHNGVTATNRDNAATAMFMWDLRLIRTYYQHQRARSNGQATKHLLDTELLVPFLHEAADRVLV